MGIVAIVYSLKLAAGLDFLKKAVDSIVIGTSLIFSEQMQEVRIPLQGKN